jgi:hypothetical protein
MWVWCGGCVRELEEDTVILPETETVITPENKFSTKTGVT